MDIRTVHYFQIHLKHFAENLSGTREEQSKKFQA